MSAPVELSWYVEYRSPNADGHKIFRHSEYTDRARMVDAVTELLGRPEVTQLRVVESPTEECPECGMIFPDCDEEMH